MLRAFVGVVCGLTMFAAALRVSEAQSTIGKEAGKKAVTLPDNVELIRDVEFGKGGERALKLHILRPKQKANQPMPALVYIFGGGWQRGDRDQGIRSLSRFAARGYFCVSIDYRLSQEAIFPAQIEDCKCAIRFLRARAKEYNVDPQRIGVWGGSAGGHLAALMGTSGGVKELEGRGGWPEFSSTVQAVCATAAPTDFVTWGDDVQPPVVKMLGGPVKDNRERAAQASPVTHVRKGMPPFLLMHGDKDDKVPLRQSEILAAALRKAGADVTLHVVKGHGHSPFGAPELATMVDEFFEKNLMKVQGK
jgi:acetyl esterase/lipase